MNELSAVQLQLERERRFREELNNKIPRNPGPKHAPSSAPINSGIPVGEVKVTVKVFPQIRSPLIEPNIQPPTYPVPTMDPITPPSNRIYVGFVDWDITIEDIKKLFQKFGKIESCDLPIKPRTGKHKGFCFIEFEHLKSAEGAISQMNGFELNRKHLKVEYAKPQKKKKREKLFMKN